MARPIDPTTIAARDAMRCPVCGIPWEPYDDPSTGAKDPGHPEDTICARHRPWPILAWIGLVAAKIDDEAIARRELVGGQATDEFTPPPTGRHDHDPK